MSQSPLSRDQNQSQTGTTDFYGWQLLYYSIRSSISKRSDLLIALAHFLITKQYHLRIVEAADTETIEGKGQRSSRPHSNGSELLPENWNRDAQKYSLHYVDEASHRYVLLAKLTRQDLVINLQNWTSKRMSIMCLQPNALVRSTHVADLGICIPEAKEILLHMRRDLVDPVVRGTRKSSPINSSSVAKSPIKVDHCQPVGKSESELLYAARSESDKVDSNQMPTKSATTMAVYQSLKSATSLDSL